MNYKSTNELMNKLNENGISINLSEKTKFINLGYYHGYKGYRFYQKASRQIPFTSFDQIYKLSEFDSQIKSLLFSPIMFIETSIKNIVLEAIMEEADSDELVDVFNKNIKCFLLNDDFTESDERLHNKAVTLYESLIDTINKAYTQRNPIVTHYYASSPLDVKIYALFELITLGDLAKIIECLNFESRKKISKIIGYNDANDTNYEVMYKYIFLIKSLRNAIAHNGIVYDARFHSQSPSKAAIETLKSATGLEYINFKSIGDYIFLVCYIEKLLGESKSKITKLLDEYLGYIDKLRDDLGQKIFGKVVQSDIKYRIETMKTFVNS